MLWSVTDRSSFRFGTAIFLGQQSRNPAEREEEENRGFTEGGVPNGY